MLKLNKNYSDYTDESDENYPEGKAVNATSSDSYDGTPILAELVNDLNAAHIAMYAKAYGSTEGISELPDNQKESQFADAVTKYVYDNIKKHADERGLSDNVHGATSEAVPGQICTRDELGNVEVGAAVKDTDAVNKKMFDDAVSEIMNFLVPVGSIKEYGGNSDPKYYFICDGRAVSRTKYAALFAVLGENYGSGDGETTFNIPDFRECVPVGAGERESGVATHDVYAVGEFKDDQMQSHIHSGTTDDGGVNHTHNMEHIHNKGNMRITGAFGVAGLSYGLNQAYGTGPFSLGNNPNQNGAPGYTPVNGNAEVQFDTNNGGWSGYTSGSLNIYSGASDPNTGLASKYIHKHGFTSDSQSGRNGNVTRGKGLGVNYIIRY